SPVARAAARPRRWPPAWFRGRSDPTRGVRSASRRRCAARLGSSPPPAGSRSTACSRWRRRWTPPVRSPAPPETSGCCSDSWRAHPPLDGRWELLLDPTTRAVPARVAARTAEETAAARRRRGAIARWFRDRVRGFDALIVPTTGYPAPGHEQATWDLGPAG